MPLRWHLDAIVIAKSLNQQAVLRMAWDNDRAVLATLHHVGLGIHAKPAAFELSMATVAVLDQNGSDLGLEKLLLLSRQLR